MEVNVFQRIQNNLVEKRQNLSAWRMPCGRARG